ncbi:glutathione S-transferase GST-6.0-like [Mercenaria mercenaria]|uniref:glutathione S-transferase GST-6.0-like n=1 Tax=Mercenaria mercenaria TaxID=6596 RepID=UPI00234F7024|nr:glutathione S-transferase GST-6.0-like [Mercenaria mercenaria]
MNGRTSLYATTLIALGALTLWLFRRKSTKRTKRPHMKFYWFDSFRSKRCEWLLAELGALQDVEFICMNPRNPDQEQLAQYRKIQPHGTVPCLEIEGKQAIIESGAICLYLADIYGKLGPEYAKEVYYNWIVYSVATLDETMEVLFIQWVHTAVEDQDENLIDKMLLKFQTFAKFLSKHMEGRDFLCGDKLTAADCVLGYNLWWAMAMRDGVLLEHYPVLQEYYNRLSRRSTFQRVFMDTT